MGGAGASTGLTKTRIGCASAAPIDVNGAIASARYVRCALIHPPMNRSETRQRRAECVVPALTMPCTISTVERDSDSNRTAGHVRGEEWWNRVACWNQTLSWPGQVDRVRLVQLNGHTVIANRSLGEHPS